jgi:branched-chain amino acid transport system ATP-binding protein
VAETSASAVRLRVSRVGVSYGGSWAVRGVDLWVYPGEILGVIGPNGAGKTSLFNALSGQASGGVTGRIWLDGESIERRSAWQRRRKGIARTFQIPRYVPDMSVVENVYSAVAYRHRRVSRGGLTAWSALDHVGLRYRGMADARDLTLAELRRLELARAMVTKPRLLMLDEVMAGLRPEEQQQLLPLIEAQAADGCAVIMVEHVMQVISALSNRVVAMAEGLVIAEGRPQEVLENPLVVEKYLGDVR